MNSSEPHWGRLAANWRLLTSPLRPAVADILLYRQAVKRWRTAAPDSACRVLLLGVTPEIRAMDWPAGTTIQACDHTLPVIEALWRNEERIGAVALPICADWRALPLPAGSRNIAIGDGCMSTLPSHAELRRMVAELDRVLEAEALLLLRLFARPAIAEDIHALSADAAAARIGSFHAFKLRLAMSLHDPDDGSVRLADIHDAFVRLFPDRATLARRSGWSPESIATIDGYRGSNTRYRFHRLDEVSAALRPEFSVVSVEYPNYELGERCPVIAARRTA